MFTDPDAQREQRRFGRCDQRVKEREADQQQNDDISGRWVRPTQQQNDDISGRWVGPAQGQPHWVVPCNRSTQVLWVNTHLVKTQPNTWDDFHKAALDATKTT